MRLPRFSSSYSIGIGLQGDMGLSENQGTLLWGRYNKDPMVLYQGALFSETPT